MVPARVSDKFWPGPIIVGAPYQTVSLIIIIIPTIHWYRFHQKARVVNHYYYTYNTLIQVSSKGTRLTWKKKGKPHLIGRIKSWDSRHTGSLQGSRHAADRFFDDIMIRRFVEGTFYDRLLSEVRNIVRWYNDTQIRRGCVLRSSAVRGKKHCSMI